MKTMRDILIVRGVPAIVTLDVETFILRGEFVGLTGKVAFHATLVSELRVKAREALDAFMAQCRSENRHPLQQYGHDASRYVLEDVYAELRDIAERRGLSLEKFVKTHTPFALKRKPTDFEKLMQHRRDVDRRYSLENED
ncbi:toxin-antitoxin system HicB [Acetobacter orientalis]|uniref:Toxin-antitoxin system HicB n=2 Tax=Acetobacter orientalis TaxID=146474 RepID=A0A252A5X7_9PROT|nr:hypothetical protein HK12_11495 [Acetobacter orientalis]BBC81202.1 toxin-antitoxin system HicB [Acetobacter orientalis]GAN66811.1 toxin-antitoxin system HicB [Acetobacter orientalis]GBR20803.1 toxin-antitoxin systems HicB [Acetobacter orientalis NRIC 0481]GEL60548.1 hypothetical protein AOR02nite_03900 [Acetobacter orientalis]